MSELITYQDNEAHILNMCKRIRRLAKLDRMSLVISGYQGPRTIHLFKYINYCGVDKQTFVKNYLSNLQPYMLSRNTKWEEADNALLNVCSQYIQDLYASDLDYPSLNETEVFFALQQIPFTSNGNSVFSNISVLIDNMSSQDGKVHKISAAFALETYVSHLILTADQKKELISLIQDRYSASSQKDLAIVINMLVDIIDDLDTESYVLTEDGQE